MKLKLLSILILILGLKSYAQTPPQQDDTLPLYNLYYLSKYITADNLSANQINQVYYSLKTAIGYDNPDQNFDDPSLSATLSKYKTISAFLDNRKFKKMQLESQLTSELISGTFPEILDKKDADELQKKFNKIITNTREYILKSKIKYLKELREGLQESDSVKIINSTTELVKLTIPETSLKTPAQVNSELAKYEKEDTENELHKANYRTAVLKYTSDYVKDKNIVSDYHIMNFSAPISSNTATTEIQLNSIIQSAEQRAASTSFSLPSESDLIKAMAIFLAKRAQQETAIWFMDQLRKNLNNPLIYEAFPETIKLIESLEDFKSPNFNVAWRYAISSDFVKMPKNLANSNWVKNLVFDNNAEKIALLSTSINFGYDLNRLISEKYNYRDIIRYFYTNADFKSSQNYVTNNTCNKAQQSIQTAISILYILTNEFFAVDRIDGRENFRLLSYEEISSLNKTQWLALGELIQIKYGKKFAADTTFFTDDYLKQDKISKWIGNLLITLSQFDKVNKDFQKALEGKNDISNYNFYNVWQITSQIIDNIDYHKYSLTNSAATNQLAKFDITLIKDCIDVYNDIQNKNFDTGIQKTMSIIEKVSAFNNEYTLNEFDLKNIKVKYTANGVFFDYMNRTYSFNFNDNDLEIIQINPHETLCTISNYTKIQPFIRFVNHTEHDPNYDLIKSIDPNFDQSITEISKLIDKDKIFVIELLKIQGLYESNGSNKDKILLFLKNSQFITTTTKGSNIVLENTKTKSKDQLFKITAFFGDVLAAKDEKELANVIDSHALPPTSYKLKRRVAHSIDLNAYVGVQASGLITNGYTSLEDQFTAGITAPVGFAFTWTTRGPKHNNYGFTIDVVDLGNIVNHYLVSSTTDYEPDVHFSEIFSPSFSGMYSIKNSPFVLFGSVKFLPLKTTTTEKGLLNNKTFDATVFSLGVKIDIPLVNLWTRIEHNQK